MEASSLVDGSAVQERGLTEDRFRNRPHLHHSEEIGVSEFGQVPGEQKELPPTNPVGRKKLVQGMRKGGREIREQESV